MAGKRGRKARSLEEKLIEIDVQFVDDIRSSTADSIKDKVVKLDRYESEIEEARKEDSSLASLKEELKTANETYSEPLKTIKLKRKYALKVLSEKGQ